MRLSKCRCRLMLVKGPGERSSALPVTLLDKLAATPAARKKLAEYVTAIGLTIEQMLANYRRIVTVVTARPLVSRDGDAAAVLVCTLAAKPRSLFRG